MDFANGIIIIIIETVQKRDRQTDRQLFSLHLIVWHIHTSQQQQQPQLLINDISLT